MFVACIFAMPSLGDDEENAKRINRDEIQAAVMSFSDTWASVIYEASLELKKNTGTPAASLHADRFRFYHAAAGFDIASSSYPGVSLLDMMVLTRLTRIVWEDYWIPQVYHEAARPVLIRLQQLESEIWNYSSSVLTVEMTNEISAVIKEWRVQHPEQVNVVFVRFSSFGALGRKPSLEKARDSGGLLGPLKDAAAAADEIRAMGDRALFLMVRMQELISGRFEISVKEILRTPEIQKLLDDISGFEQNADQYAELLDALPDEIAEATGKTIIESFETISIERQAAINQILIGVALERSATIVQIMDGVKLERYAAIVQILDGVKQERHALIQNAEDLVQHSEQQAETMITHVFILLLALVLLSFLLWLVVRFVLSKQSISWLTVLGAGAVLIVIAALILTAVLTYVNQTDPKLPPASDTTEPADESSQMSTTLPAGSETEHKPVEDVDVLSIQVLFVSNSTEINPRFYTTLDAIIELLASDSQLQLKINGHSDNYGADSDNLDLSELRVSNIASYLKQAGLDEHRIQVHAFGSSQPVAANDTVTGRAQNRRVELNIFRIR